MEAALWTRQEHMVFLITINYICQTKKLLIMLGLRGASSEEVFRSHRTAFHPFGL
jgi:hypothetical protein